MDGGRRHVIRVFDLQTGDVKSFDPGDGKDIDTVAFLPDGGLLISGFGGLRRLDLETGSFELLLAQPGGAFLGPDGRHVLLLHTARTSKSLWVRRPCMTCANGAAGRCRHTETR